MSAPSWCFALYVRILLLGLIGVLRQAMGPEEDLDAVELMKNVDDAGEEGEAFGKQKFAHWKQTDGKA